MEEYIKLLEVITHLIGVLVWPGLIAAIVLRFGPQLGHFISSLAEASVKGAGFEATWKTQAAAALAVAAVVRSEDKTASESTADHVRDAAVTVEGVSARTLSRARSAQILWVDDRPENNERERDALEAVGVRFILSTSTDDALTKIQKQSFDVIISDMSRPPDERAGYTLLNSLRSSGNNIPFIIYAGTGSPDQQAEARHHGALGSTNRAVELFGMVLAALGQS